MSFAAWIVPLGLVAGALIAAAFQWRTISKLVYSLARDLKNKYVFSNPKELASRSSAEPVPEPLHEQLIGPHFWEAVDKLVTYAKSVKPEFIIGLNTGGRLLASYVSSKIELNDNNCIYLESAPDRPGGFKIYNSELNLEGTILVIDDVSRSGSTLENAKLYIENRNFRDNWSISKVYFAVLVVTSAIDPSQDEFRPDFVSYGTSIFYFGMPWSELSARVKLNLELSKRFSHRTDKQVLSTYSKIVSDNEFSRSIFYRLARGDN